MREIIFVDTSVLLNICNVPDHNQQHLKLSEELLRISEDDDLILVIPVASLIETGNHIEHVSDGNLRRRCAEILDGLIEMSVLGTVPWVITNSAWDERYLTALRLGIEGTAIPTLIDAATWGAGLGLGDLSIVHEAHAYRDRADLPAAMPVRVWTLDGALDSIAQASLQ